MTPRRSLKFLAAFVLAMLVAAVPAWGLAGQNDIEINEFRVVTDNTQAGASPNVRIVMRFCGPGLKITDATNTTPITLTTETPHNLAFDSPAVVSGVTGNFAANGVWSPLPFSGVRPTGPNTLELIGSAGNGAYTGGGELQLAPKFGCSDSQGAADLKDFILGLPPGFLGNPTATPVCPQEQLNAFPSCPGEDILGRAVIHNLVNKNQPRDLPTELFNAETLGDEPARLATRVFPSNPGGPFPITVSVRTTGDYGIDSTNTDTARNLGGPAGVNAQIDTVLCSQAPCTISQEDDVWSNLIFGPNARPFFRNPTSCGTKTVTLDATSWKDDPAVAHAEATFEVTGCENVPFEPEAGIVPTDTSQASAPSGQQISISYPPYADAPIWQSALKHADVSLPDGLVLSPGGGRGLEACDYTQFGVNPATLKQTNNDPVSCPDGSQVGVVTVTSPVLPTPIEGRVFFGPTSGPGRPTPESPWKLFLLLEGHGLRIKLAGDVSVSPTGQIRTVFKNQPEVPFETLQLRMRGGDTAVLTNPSTCEAHKGNAVLTGYANDKVSQPALDNPPTVTPTGCPPEGPPFAPKVEEASASPEQAGANSVSKIVITRQDGEEMITGLRLSLPAGAVGSLAVVPKCPIGDARAGNCSADSKVGTVKTTVGSGNDLLTVFGSLYLAEAAEPGDAAAIVLDVPAKVGPIDLGHVIVINRVILRQSDTGVDVISTGIPTIVEGVPQPLRRIEITVDREGFFLNPTGCDPRPLTATFTSASGRQSSSTLMLHATGCDKLPFNPRLRLIAGGRKLTAKGKHPPLKAILTQQPGEANIKRAQVVLPDILRPNVPEFNEPGGLCNEVDFVVRRCPAGSLVGNARVVTPVLPFELSGPVYVVQEMVDPLPRLFVLLRGGGFEVPLRARNFFQGIRTVNVFEAVPDVPQSYFELNITGGKDGILNNFFDLCKSSVRKFDVTFTGQNGKVADYDPLLEVRGCGKVRGASIRSKKVKVSRKGVAKVKIACRRTDARCKGRLTLRRKRAKIASKKFSIKSRKTRMVKVKLKKKPLKALRRAKHMRVNAVATVNGAGASSKSLRLVLAKKRR